MPRQVAEWIGRTDNAMPAPLVRLRIFETRGGCCYICTRKIQAGDRWDIEHIKPIWDGGENRESNIAPACVWCHGQKTKVETSQRAEGKRHRAKAAGIKKKVKRPMPGSRASGLKKRLDGTVVRR